MSSNGGDSEMIIEHPYLCGLAHCVSSCAPSVIPGGVQDVLCTWEYQVRSRPDRVPIWYIPRNTALFLHRHLCHKSTA
jgi:hypothetical protein